MSWNHVGSSDRLAVPGAPDGVAADEHVRAAVLDLARAHRGVALAADAFQPFSMKTVSLPSAMVSPGIGT